MTQNESVQQAQRGDTQAYGKLVRQHERSVFATALAITRDRHAAEDITQETFIQGFAKIGSLKDSTRFVFWLNKIARRQALLYLKKQGRRKTFAMTDDDAPPTQRNGQLLTEELEHLLYHVQKLPKHERLIISLRYFDGHSTNEISEMTGRPLGTVTKQLSRAIKRLKTALELEAS